MFKLTSNQILELVKEGRKLPLATQNYPSRGQTAVQELYQTTKGKFFLKRSSKRNHTECQIDINNGSLAEREYWAYSFAHKIGLHVPQLWLIDTWTTIQIWFDFPDARTFATSQGKMLMLADYVFNCSLFDWITGQIDRHDANYLYNYVDQEIILIDSAHCFLKYNGSIPDYLKYFEIGFSNQLNKKMDTVVNSNIIQLNEHQAHNLVPLREPSEIKAFIKRLNEIKKCHCINDIVKLYRGN